MTQEQTNSELFSQINDIASNIFFSKTITSTEKAESFITIQEKIEKIDFSNASEAEVMNLSDSMYQLGKTSLSNLVDNKWEPFNPKAENIQTLVTNFTDTSALTSPKKTQQSSTTAPKKQINTPKVK